MKDIVDIIGNKGIWYSLKNTKGGHPHHPLYLKKNLTMIEFDIKSYIEEFNSNQL